MRRGAALVVLVAALGVGLGCGPRVVQEEYPTEPEGLSIELLGKIWYWTCEDGNPHQKFLQFRQDGTAHYDYVQGSDPASFTYDNATWEIRDGKLLISYNHGYAIDVFPLEDRDGELLIGIPARTRRCPAVYMRPVE